jgi:hypothetical protein
MDAVNIDAGSKQLRVARERECCQVTAVRAAIDADPLGVDLRQSL